MKHLLPNVPKYFKTNLHTHSTVSDGKLSVEELKQEYKSRGYSVVAFTDHEVCFSHQDLNDEDFLALTGYEMLTDQWELPKSHTQTYHFNFIAKDPENRWQIFNPVYRPATERHLDKIVCDGYEERTYNLEKMNEIIARAREKGFLVTYNHPAWSMQDARDYIGLEGIWGVEVFNGECYMLGADDDMSQCYQEMLREGKRLFPLATDDTHSPRAIGMGWVMVGAEKLEYGSVIEALEKGDFYASSGPEIHSLTVEDDIVTITCSGAVSINMLSHCRIRKRVLAEPGHQLFTAQFDISSWLRNCMDEWKDKAFVRFIVTDPMGRKAYTRAYWRDEILGE